MAHVAVCGMGHGEGEDNPVESSGEIDFDNSEVAPVESSGEIDFDNSEVA